MTGFVNLIEVLRKNKITPIFVFDGLPYPEKNITIEKKGKSKNVERERNIIKKII